MTNVKRQELIGAIGSLVLVIFACTSVMQAQVAKQANSHYQTHEQRQRMAQGLDSPGRDQRQKPELLVAHMGLRPGMTVADIGTGGGYMLPFLSQAVGASGRVLGEDIFADFLSDAKARAEKDHLTNVAFIQGTETDPDLPANSVDVALSLDSYHHFNYPAKMLAGIHRALRNGGRYVLVDYYRSPTAMANGFAMKHIRLDKPGVIQEVEANHFRLVSQRDQIPSSQYMLIFERD